MEALAILPHFDDFSMLFFDVRLSGVRGLLRLSVPCAIILLLMGASLEKENGRLLRSFKKTGEKVFNYLKGHWKWMAFAAGCVLFLYAVYFAFSFRMQPIYQSVDQAYWGVRNILFRVFCGVFDLGIFVWGVWLYARGRLSARNACVLLAFMAMITSMCYSFSTPIWVNPFLTEEIYEVKPQSSRRPAGTGSAAGCDSDESIRCRNHCLRHRICKQPKLKQADCIF